MYNIFHNTTISYIDLHLSIFLVGYLHFTSIQYILNSNLLNFLTDSHRILSEDVFLSLAQLRSQSTSTTTQSTTYTTIIGTKATSVLIATHKSVQIKYA